MTEYQFKIFKKNIEDKELLKNTPIRGTVELILTFSSFMLFMMYLYFVGIYSIFGSIIAGTILSIIMSRAIFIIHDILHTQYFKRKKISTYISKLFIILVGNSPSWWAANHQLRHHPYVNIVGKDKDIEIMGGIFTNKKLIPKSLIVKYKYFIFWGGMFLVYSYFIKESYKFLVRHKRYAELIFMLLHIIIVWLPIFFMLGASYGFTILLTVYLLLSLWMGLVFSMNHLGCEVFTQEEAKLKNRAELQMAVSRSLSYSIFKHWFYGGLNAHIEHHMFPTASRFKLHKIQKELKEFCNSHNIFYREESAIGSYETIVKILSDYK